MTAREIWCARMRARILRHIEIHESGCWLWRGRRNNMGYGTLNCRMKGYRNPVNLLTHRVAWEVFRQRRIPRGRVVAHHFKCVSNACCNWEHVRATTQSHNLRDIKRAKRWKLRNPRIEFPPTHTIIRRAA
jgi:hypothetical protein